MIDTSEAQTNSEIRDIVKDVLVDVINSFSETAEDTLKGDSVETKEDSKKEEKPEEEKKEEKEEKKEEENSGVEAANAVVSTDLETDPVVNSAEPVTTKVSAVPKVEVLNENIGQVGTPPVVNNVPPTTDVNQTLGSYDAVPNTAVTNTRSDDTVTPSVEVPPVTDVPAPAVDNTNSGELNTFGTSIVYSMNEDGTFNVTFEKNGVTRVSVVPSLMTVDILPELEDFLVEAMGNTPATETPVDPVVDTPVEEPLAETPVAEDPVPSEIPPVEEPLPGDPVAPEITDAGPIQEENKEEDILPSAAMSSLRKQYAGKVMEIFKLGLMTKNAIVSESKDKFFAKNKEEFDKKNAVISGEIEKKKKGLLALTKEYLRIKEERDQIKNAVGIISSAIKKSQLGLSDGYLTDKNSEKIISVVSSIVNKLIDNYDKPGFKSVLASSIDNSRKVKFLVASEIANNKKKALAASKIKDNKKNNNTAAKDSGIVASRKSSSKTQEFNNIKLNAKENLMRAGVLGRKSGSKSSNVIVESNYVGRSNDTISRVTRHDGMDEMIGEITNLL